MKNLIVAIVVMLFGVSANAQNTEKLLSNYFSLKNALVSSDSKSASNAIAVLNEAVKSDGNFAQKAELQKATEKLIKVGNNLENQRAAFNDLSILLWKIVKSSENVSQPVYYQNCPMKKAYWLSKEKEIKNPYFGSTMLTCGKIVETK